MRSNPEGRIVRARTVPLASRSRIEESTGGRYDVTVGGGASRFSVGSE
jgi:hypothetical protein